MNNRRILIVDDEPHVRRVLRIALEREGYAVEMAGNGVEALACIDTCRPDAMITDIHMPQLDGRGLCAAARTRYPDESFLIMVMTSLTAREEREWVQRLSHIQFLEKPLSTRKMLSDLSAYFSVPRSQSNHSIQSSHAGVGHA